MQSVKVKKDELKTVVQTNRDAHIDTYNKARVGYRKQLIEWFDTQKKRALDGEHFQTAFTEPKPEDHTTDYDTVLDMLEMSTDTIIVLSNLEFKNYVRDDWGWSGQFTTTASKYMAEA